MDILRYSYQMENAIKLGGLVFSIHPLHQGSMSQQSSQIHGNPAPIADLHAKNIGRNSAYIHKILT